MKLKKYRSHLPKRGKTLHTFEQRSINYSLINKYNIYRKNDCSNLSNVAHDLKLLDLKYRCFLFSNTYSNYQLVFDC